MVALFSLSHFLSLPRFLVSYFSFFLSFVFFFLMINNILPPCFPRFALFLFSTIPLKPRTQDRAST